MLVLSATAVFFLGIGTHGATEGPRSCPASLPRHQPSHGLAPWPHVAGRACQPIFIHQKTTPSAGRNGSAHLALATPTVALGAPPVPLHMCLVVRKCEITTMLRRWGSDQRCRQWRRTTGDGGAPALGGRLTRRRGGSRGNAGCHKHRWPPRNRRGRCRFLADRGRCRFIAGQRRGQEIRRRSHRATGATHEGFLYCERLEHRLHRAAQWAACASGNNAV